VSTDAERPPTPVRDRIMAAAVRCAERSGVRRFSLEDVAAEAEVSRTTIYRQFPGGRDQLVQEAATWEVARFWRRVGRAVAGESTLEDRLVTGIMVGADMIARSRIMAGLGEAEFEELAVALRPSDPLVHGVIRDELRRLLAAEQSAGRVGAGVDLDRAADYLTRMTLSVLSSPAGVDLTDRDATAALVRTQFLGGIAPVAPS
jgi:AcrR family transcriptional regulator